MNKRLLGTVVYEMLCFPHDLYSVAQRSLTLELRRANSYALRGPHGENISVEALGQI